jgi:hypothetical protein
MHLLNEAVSPRCKPKLRRTHPTAQHADRAAKTADPSAAHCTARCECSFNVIIVTVFIPSEYDFADPVSDEGGVLRFDDAESMRDAPCSLRSCLPSSVALLSATTPCKLLFDSLVIVIPYINHTTQPTLTRNQQQITLKRISSRSPVTMQVGVAAAHGCIT